MTYRPSKVPPRRLHHENWRRGYRVNSAWGAYDAKHLGKTWIDNDGHISAPDGDAKPTWVNSHGTPETFWLPKGDRFENHTWTELSRMRKKRGGEVFHLRDLRRTLLDNATYDIGTEWDVKNLRPWASDENLDDLMARFARHAKAAYGRRWQQRVNMKTVTEWGLPYSLRLCRAAHKHDIPTLLSVRGKHRFNRFIGHEEVTYVRGSAVIR